MAKLHNNVAKFGTKRLARVQKALDRIETRSGLQLSGVIDKSHIGASESVVMHVTMPGTTFSSLAFEAEDMRAPAFEELALQVEAASRGSTLQIRMMNVW